MKFYFTVNYCLYQTRTDMDTLIYRSGFPTKIENAFMELDFVKKFPYFRQVFIDVHTSTSANLNGISEKDLKAFSIPVHSLILKIKFIYSRKSLNGT